VKDIWEMPWPAGRSSDSQGSSMQRCGLLATITVATWLLETKCEVGLNTYAVQFVVKSAGIADCFSVVIASPKRRRLCKTVAALKSNASV